MKKNSLLLAILMLVNCTLESKFSFPNNQKIDLNLTATWIHDNDPNNKIIIKKKNDKSYTIIIDDCNTVTAYPYRLEGHDLMVAIDNDRYLFYGYKYEKEQLKIMEINRKLREVDFNSQKELISFFIKNITRHDFFLEPILLTKL